MTGYNPAWYFLPAAVDELPGVLVIEDALSYIYIGDGKSLPRRKLAFEVAQELVDTYISANLNVSAEAKPGILYFEGALTVEKVLIEYPDEVEAARTKQLNWFKALIREADDKWQRFHIHREISDPQRHAAKALGLTREWMFDNAKERNFQDCPACGSNIKAGVSICPQCRTELKENEFVQAGR